MDRLGCGFDHAPHRRLIAKAVAGSEGVGEVQVGAVVGPKACCKTALGERAAGLRCVGTPAQFALKAIGRIRGEIQKMLRLPGIDQFSSPHSHTLSYGSFAAWRNPTPSAPPISPLGEMDCSSRGARHAPAG